jgi:hypothetical protein
VPARSDIVDLDLKVSARCGRLANGASLLCRDARPTKYRSGHPLVQAITVANAFLKQGETYRLVVAVPTAFKFSGHEPAKI